MKSVCICGSRKFKPEVRKFAKELEKAGVTVFIPYHHSGQEEWENLSEAYKKFVALGLTHDHFYKIKMADVIFVYKGNCQVLAPIRPNSLDRCLGNFSFL